jgi:serine/threonine protein phosphatase PrpC
MQTGTFEDTIEAACRRLEAVNEQLVREAARSLLGDRSGSTVVALLARGAKCAVIWAGDSRAYRCRSGRFEQLTRDHSAAQSNTVVTRAVGPQPKFEPEVCRGDVRPGDRYLLCSDGLTRVLPEATMRACVEAPELGRAVQGLVEATLDAGAPDNVTALLVEAVEDSGDQRGLRLSNED